MFTYRLRVLSTLSVFIMVVLPLLSACNLTSSGEPADNDAVFTAAAQTVQAKSLQKTLDAQQALLTSQAQTLQAPPSAAT